MEKEKSAVTKKRLRGWQIAIIVILCVVVTIFIALDCYLNHGLPMRMLILGNKEITPNLSDMTLVKEYQFDEASIEANGWIARSNTVRRDGFWNRDTISFKNGKAVFDVSYHSEGLGGTYVVNKQKVDSPAGFYGAAMRSADTFKFGYIEASIKMPNVDGAWGAFWLSCDNLQSANGKDGQEIDIVEARYNSRIISQALYYNYPNLQSQLMFRLSPVNVYDNFVRYGMLWDTDRYEFYCNGVKIGESNFGGVSQVEQHLLLSTEFSGTDFFSQLFGLLTKDTTQHSTMEIEYVKVYQFNKYLA